MSQAIIGTAISTGLQDQMSFSVSSIVSRCGQLSRKNVMLTSFSHCACVTLHRNHAESVSNCIARISVRFVRRIIVEICSSLVCLIRRMYRVLLPLTTFSAHPNLRMSVLSLSGEIRSAFLMTEPGVASSDATNIACSIQRSEGSYIISGRKWWSTGAMDPRCKVRHRDSLHCSSQGITDAGMCRASELKTTVGFDS